MTKLEAGSGKPEDALPAELRRALEQMDVKAHAAANRLNVDKVGAGTLAKLKSTPYARTPVRRYAIRAAAVLAVVAGALLFSRDASRGLPVALDSLSVADSQAVLAVVNEVAVADTSVTVSAVSVEDLNEQELRALLQALENEESL